MSVWQQVIIGIAIMASPTVFFGAVLALSAHIMRVRADRRSLRELREYRHNVRERERAERAALLSTWG